MKKFLCNWKNWVLSGLLIHFSGALAFGVSNVTGRNDLSSAVLGALIAAFILLPLYFPFHILYIAVVYFISRFFKYSKMAFYSNSLLQGALLSFNAWDKEKLNFGPSFLAGSIAFVLFAESSTQLEKGKRQAMEKDNS